MATPKMPKTVVEVYPGSFAAGSASVEAMASMATGLFAAQGDASGARSPSVLQQIEEDNGMSLLAFSEVSPLALATYCNALANCKAVLMTVQPSLGALLLCPVLRDAIAALLGCGCTIRFPGGSASLPSFARLPARGASGAWFSAPYSGFLRLQLAGFFLEVPYYKANEPSMLLAEASRAGILRDAEPNQSFVTVIAYHGQKLFECDTTDVTGDWKRLEDRDQFLAMELQSSKRRGVWLFVGHHFAQVTEGRPDSSASEVHAENGDFQVIVGQVTSPGRLESFTAEGHSSVHFNAMVDSGTFKDGMFEWTLDGEVQRWKVHEMTFNPFVSIAKELDPNEVATDKVAGSGYPTGSKVKYWSVTVQRWIPAIIVSQNQDGTYRLDVKKRAEPHHLRPHQAGDLMPPRPDKAPGKQKKGRKKARDKAPEVQDTSEPSSSEAKRKRKKTGKDKRSQKKEKTKPSSNSEDSSSRSSSNSSKGETSATSSSSLQSSPSLSPKRKAPKDKQRKNDKAVKKRTSSSA